LAVVPERIWMPPDSCMDHSPVASSRFPADWSVVLKPRVLATVALSQRTIYVAPARRLTGVPPEQENWVSAP